MLLINIFNQIIFNLHVLTVINTTRADIKIYLIKKETSFMMSLYQTLISLSISGSKYNILTERNKPTNIVHLHTLNL